MVGHCRTLSNGGQAGKLWIPDALTAFFLTTVFLSMLRFFCVVVFIEQVCIFNLVSQSHSRVDLKKEMK